MAALPLYSLQSRERDDAEQFFSVSPVAGLFECR
jgi:hypothetical protein